MHEAVHQLKAHHADDHGDHKNQCFGLAVRHGHHGRARAKAGPAPARAEEQAADDEWPVDLRVGGQAQHAAQKIAGAFFGQGKGKKSDGDGAAHNQGEGRIPGTGQVQKANDLAGVGHARKHEPQAEQETDRKFADAVEKVVVQHGVFLR